jgi:hypothetical protein
MLVLDTGIKVGYFKKATQFTHKIELLISIVVLNYNTFINNH